jgi:DNA ligase-1
MRFQTLAASLEQLEATRSRLTAVRIIAQLLQQAGPGSIEPIVYLLQGQLRPAYEGVELGLGAKLLVRVLAEAYRKSPAVVERRLRTAGDLGLVAGSLAPIGRRAVLRLQEVHRALLHAARVTGAGSVDRKVRLLAALLRRATATEAKYVVRILQGRLRLGVGDQTILVATALAALGDGRKRALVEHAYNVRCDLGSVAHLALSGGERALKRIGPRPGIPVRPALAQRLRSAEDIIERLGTVQAEPKFDGFRLQLHRDAGHVWVFSRRLENVTNMFPDLAAALRRQLKARRAILEGEAMVYDPASGEFLPFQVTMTRKRKTGIAEAAERHPLRLFAFDLLYADGRNYIPRAQRERSRRLRQLLRRRVDDPIAVAETVTTDQAGELQAYFDGMIERGLEGIVAKRPDAPYHPGAREYTWVKLKRAYQQKLRDTVDLVIVGFLAGRGKRAPLGIGSLLGAVYDPEHDRFRTVAKIGSGPSEQQWRELHRQLQRQAVRSRPRRVDSRVVPDVWVEPTYVVEVLADEVTRSPTHTCGQSGDAPGYALRFPRMLNGVRTDRAPEDATTEQEILELAALQRRGAAAQDVRASRPRSRASAKSRTTTLIPTMARRKRGASP